MCTVKLTLMSQIFHLYLLMMSDKKFQPLNLCFLDILNNKINLNKVNFVFK